LFLHNRQATQFWASLEGNEAFRDSSLAISGADGQEIFREHAQRARDWLTERAIK
jgi:hypothetical protein